MQKLIISLICCLLPALTFADTLSVRDGAPDSYVVQKGDTLWDISAKFFKDPWRWPKIWGLNKEAIKNPHWIYPGDVVVLDRTNGTLHVVETTPQPTEVAPPPVTTPETTETPETPEGETESRVGKGVRVRPTVHVREGQHDAIPSIPYGDIKPFLNQTLVIEKGEFDQAPMIVAGFEHKLLSMGDVAYVKNLPDDKGLDWQIYRPGEPLVDPLTKKILGYEANFMGTVHVDKFDKISTVMIDSATSEINPGDRLVQSAGEYPENFIPRAPDSEITARVIKIVNGISLAGKQSIVVINQGRREGMQNGHVLALYRKGETVKGAQFKSRDIELPNVRYGLLFVFRTFENVSYGLVVQARMPVEMLDVAQTP
ncbi:MAG TPA: LysM peptidoglycan-binding domain-containing protein [Gallionellaceae bacterium]